MPRRSPDPPQPPQRAAPAFARASWQVIYARRMVNAHNRFRPRVYAYPMQFEPIQGGRWQTEVTLECVDSTWFNARLGGTADDFWRANPVQPVSRVTLMLGPSINRNMNGGIQFSAQIQDPDIDGTGNAHLDDRTWYQITLADEVRPRPPLATYERLGANDDFEAPMELSVLRIEAVPGPLAADLAEKYQIDGSGVSPHAMLDSPQVAFAAVLNVGQGGCNAIYGTDGRPFLFYDFGRSVGSDSRPDSMKPCLGSAPQIVLSNWDKDHHELGRTYPEARHLPWLCLEGPAGPVTGGFFRSLTHKRVWPEDRMKFEEYPWGFVLRSNDGLGNSNDNGLVVLVRVRDDSEAPPLGQRRALDAEGARPEIFPDERYLLMTGDAMFQHIPSCAAHDLDGKIIGINAVHHGSYDGMVGYEECIPLAADPVDDHPATVAFSYGFNRATGTHSGGYGHPHREAVEWYKFRGYYHRINTNAEPTGIPAAYAPQNIVLGWRRGAVAAPVGLAAAAIAAARLAYDNAVNPARAAFEDCEATRVLQRAADGAKAGTAANVHAAVTGVMLTPAYTGLAVSAAATLTITAAVVLCNTRANGMLAYADIETLDHNMYDAAVLAAAAATVQAQALSVAIAAQDPAYPQVQPVHCEGAAVAAVVHPPPWPVTDPPVTTTSSVGPVRPNAPLRNITVRERQDDTVVLHKAHGLATGDQVTIAGSADGGTNAAHAITRVDADSYTIPHSRGGMPVAESATASRAVAGAFAPNAPVQDTGHPLTIVRHSEHSLQAGSNVTIAAATVGAFNGMRAFALIDACSYGLDIAGVAAGTTGVTAQSSGTRSRETFKELCNINDGGVAPTTITHLNHRVANQAKLDIQHTTHAVHAGKRKVTVTGVNTYTIPATFGAAFAEVGVRVEGTRTNFAFPNEPVEIAVGDPVSTVTYLGHGLHTGDYVTLTNGTDAAYAGTHRITRLDGNTFQINVGPGDGNVYTADVSRHAGQFNNVPVLLRDPGRVSIVEDQGHGLNTGVVVTIQNTTNFDGAHQIACIDDDHYAIAAVTGGVVNDPGQAAATAPVIAFVAEPVATQDTGMLTQIYHPNHGLQTGAIVTLTNGGHAGAHAITRVDANRYTIAHSVGTDAESYIRTGAGAPLDVSYDAAGVNVMLAGHGLANGAPIAIQNSLHGPLNGNHLITYVDANNFTVPIVVAAGYREIGSAVTAAGERAATEGTERVPCSPPPSDEQVCDWERDMLTNGTRVQKGRMASAIAVARRHEGNPGTCAGNHCAFRALHRH